MIVYTVSARFMRADVAEAWLAWLIGGHMAEVLAGGATSAEVVKHEVPGDAPHAAVFTIHYRFPTSEAFAAYERDHAPRLRAEGLARFPLALGVSYERSVGEVVCVVP